MAQNTTYDDPTATSVPAPTGWDAFRPKLQSVYKKYLGRDLGQNEGANWYGNDNYERDIFDSPEAVAYRQRQPDVATSSTPSDSTPSKTWDENTFWNELLGSGGRTTTDLTNWLNSSGYGKLGVKQFGSKGDKITLPGGTSWDVVMSAGDGGGKGFYKGSLEGARDAGYSAATSTAAKNPLVEEALSRLFARGFSPVDANDPTIQAQFGATSRTIDRGAQKARQQAAERAAYGGTLTGGEGGAFDATVNGINEKATEQKGGVMADLMAQELQARRQDVITALSAAQGEERMGLEAYLAQLNNELQRYGIDTNAGLQRLSLGNQNQQFYDTLSWNMANSANSNNALLSSILQLFS